MQWRCVRPPRLSHTLSHSLDTLLNLTAYALSTWTTLTLSHPHTLTPPHMLIPLPPLMLSILTHCLILRTFFISSIPEHSCTTTRLGAWGTCSYKLSLVMLAAIGDSVRLTRPSRGERVLAFCIVREREKGWSTQQCA